jgi:hypothetical protein
MVRGSSPFFEGGKFDFLLPSIKKFLFPLKKGGREGF